MTLNQHTPANHSPLPAGILSGFLGAGKATGLNHVLSDHEAWPGFRSLFPEFQLTEEPT